MPVDNEKIKKALDDFENDDFLSAKEIIKTQVHGAVQDYYKEKLGLQKDLEPKQTTDTDIADSGTGADDDA